MVDMSFMRAEVWHALAVHFPIAILPLSVILMLISFFRDQENKIRWQKMAAVLLFIGTAGAWIAFLTGSEAEGFVSRKICDPTVLKDHEIAGEAMTYIFTIATVIVFLGIYRFKERFQKLSVIIGFLAMVMGFGFLVYTGHIGASLVYEQGAGVKNHQVDCSEFE